MNKFKFEWQFMDGGASTKVGSVEICRPKLTMEFQADGLDEIFRTFGTFLRGCGYEFKGDVVCEDYNWGDDTVTKYKSFKKKVKSASK
jgi:hypothetical protein